MAVKKLGELIDEMYQIREERSDLSAQDKELKSKYDELSDEITAQLQRQDIDGARGELASVSLSETDVPAVKDWNKLTPWIKKNDAMHLFERRISKSSWVELLNLRKGRPIPGIEAFTKIGLNLSKRSK